VPIPFALVNKHIVVRVNVNGSRPLSFVLDTGAKEAIIKLDRAKELGLNLYGQVSGGGAGPARTSGSLIRDATLGIPELPGFSQPLTLALPLLTLSPALGQEIDGIIGGRFIEQFVLELDYEARRITLHNKDRFSYSGPGESLPIQFDSNGHPVLNAEVTPLNGAPIAGAFLLDIGSGGTLVLHSPFVTKHQLLGPQLKTIRAIGAAGAGGDTKGQVSRVAELKIGTFKFSSPITMFSEDQAGSFANPSLAGNIGGQIASRFRMFLDYSHRRVILEPSSTFGQAFDKASGGLSVRAEGQDYRTFRVRQVLENSPASEAGLQEGDIISMIDGKPASEFTLTDLLEMFERPISREVRVRRGERVLTTTLTPRKLV
jgi:predicted aspartyl protease